MGWAWVTAACDTLLPHDELHVVLDERDALEVSAALEEKYRDRLEALGQITLHPVPLPRWASKRYGGRRTRLSYMSWFRRARSAADMVCRLNQIEICHQITFASAVLPHAIPRARATRAIWGPIAVPVETVREAESKQSMKRRLSNRFVCRLARYNSRNVAVCIAQNYRSADVMRRGAGSVVVEPNIVVPPVNVGQRDRGTIVFSGNLIPRKRPWLVIDALKSKELANTKLSIIGDGPLRSALENQADQLGLSPRVRFCGRLTRAEALEAVASAGVLVLPSIREGAPWVVGEALTAGVPVVVSEASGAGDLVALSGSVGLIVGENASAGHQHADEYARAIRSALNSDTIPTGRFLAARLPAFLNSVWFDSDRAERPSAPESAVDSLGRSRNGE